MQLTSVNKRCNEMVNVFLNLDFIGENVVAILTEQEG